MYTAILVPLDGSLFAEQALPLALEVARQSGATLYLARVHVAAAQGSNAGARDRQIRERERDYLSAIAERLAPTWRGKIHITLLDGPVAESIAAYTTTCHSDLVVLSTHGRGGISRLWLGSVADRLMRRLEIPLLLTRPREDDPATSAAPPASGHILIPLDGTAASERIIPHALAMGRLMGARYTLLQTLELIGPIAEQETYTPTEREMADLMEDARRYLDRIAAQLRAEACSVRTELLIGPPALVILDYARDHAVDLIALETQARSGSARLFVGSVADKIVRGAHAPVLLHRPPSAPKTLVTFKS